MCGFHFIYMSSQNPFIFLSPVPNDYPIMLWRHDDVTWHTQCKSRSYTTCTGICVYLFAARYFLIILHCFCACACVWMFSPMFLDRNYLQNALVCVCLRVCVCLSVFHSVCLFVCVCVCVCLFVCSSLSLFLSLSLSPLSLSLSLSLSVCVCETWAYCFH